MKSETIVFFLLFISFELINSYKLQKRHKEISRDIIKNKQRGKMLWKERTYGGYNAEEFPNPIKLSHIKGNQFGSQQPGSPYPTETDEPNPNGPPLNDDICHNMTAHETTQESDFEESSPENNMEAADLPGTENPSDESNEEGSGSLDQNVECEQQQEDLTSAEILLDSCEKSRGQFPSKSSCKSFVNCWDGSAYEQNCPAGLLFSNEGFCDYPYNVDCGNRPMENKKPKSCETPFSVYRSPTSCSEFFVCVHGCPVKFVCPDRLQFNEDLEVCDYEYRVGCVQEEATEKEDGRQYSVV